MLPEFRQAVSITKAEGRKLDRLIQQGREFGYPRAKTGRRKVRASKTQGGVPENGLGGGESGTGA